jgi:hypothetical protein
MSLSYLTVNIKITSNQRGSVINTNQGALNVKTFPTICKTTKNQTKPFTHLSISFILPPSLSWDTTQEYYLAWYLSTLSNKPIEKEKFSLPDRSTSQDNPHTSLSHIQL